MCRTDSNDWPVADLRLAYFDFTLRGEGDRTVVAEVLQRCLALGLISVDTASLWQDALEWRALGGVLPGWAVPTECLSIHPPGTGSDEDQILFEEWRAERSSRIVRPAATANQRMAIAS